MRQSRPKARARGNGVLRVVIGVLTLGAVVALAACGDSDSSNNADTQKTTASTTGSTTGTTAGAPCGGAAAVEAAVRQSSVAGLNQVSDQFDVTNVVVAQSDPTWARFSDAPKAGIVTFQGGYGVVNCQSGAWVVTDAGSADVGCQTGTPLAVLADLKLDCIGP
jgi:hypothetical protein